jgi:iron complex transport system permease protein
MANSGISRFLTWQIFTLTVALLLTALVSLLVGSTDLSILAVLSGLMGGQDDIARTIVWEIRMPRIILGLMAGASLGLSGAALQGLLRNPLADPGVIGVSASAGLGAVIAIYFGVSSVFLLAIPVFAMVGAVCATLVLFVLASRDTSILTLILAGIAINGLAAAATTLVMNFAPTPFSLLDMVMWLMGSLSNRSFTDVLLAGPFMVFGWGLTVGVGQGLSALSLGEDAAQTLGIDLKKVRLQVIMGTAVSVGAAVAVCGAIGFVGLIVPHIMRHFVGQDPKDILLPSALGGAIFLALADLVTRIPFASGELRLGVVTAFIGSPVFLYIVIKTREVMR